MSDVDKYKEAEQRWLSGDSNGAASIHIDLCLNGRNERVRMQSALLLVERLRAIDHLPELLRICDIGIGCAQRMNELAYEANLMAKKAEYLVVLNGVGLVPARKSLRMAPGWFAFSLERDAEQFQELTKKIEANDAEADRLLEGALRTSEQAGSHSAKAQVLMCAANTRFHRYMNLKMEFLTGAGRVPYALIRLLRPYGLDELFLYTKAARKEMRKCLSECESNYLAATDAFRKGGEEAQTAYAYYNLANDLRSAFRFCRAKKYLRMAKQIAERHGDKRLFPGIKAVEKSIRMRNRDTPNYLAGESRKPLE